MSTFDETKHPRGMPGNGGQFARKEAIAPSGELTGAATSDFQVAILTAPDPAGEFDMRVDAPTGSHYMRDGVLHRVGGPAYEGHDGSEAWFSNGELHRDPADGPAVVDEDFEEFYQHGRLVAP